jgi:hypothetical protein
MGTRSTASAARKNYGDKSWVRNTSAKRVRSMILLLYWCASGCLSNA